MTDPAHTAMVLAPLAAALAAVCWWIEYRLGGGAFGLTGGTLMASALLVVATCLPRLLPGLAMAMAAAVVLLVWRWRKRARRIAPPSEVGDGNPDPT